MNEYLNVIRNNYANFTGRARRREYWMFTLINGIILILLQIPVQGAALAMVAQMQAQTNAGVEATPNLGFTGITLIFALLLFIYSLAVLVPSLAVTVRRLHDTGKSGWLILLNLIPFIGGLILLVFLVTDSEAGANKWGPNPKGLGQNAAAPANNW
ncbi:DUF805 domain-containing protein [Deinococcus sp. HMF7620]|uniref:DUF805 domain-containing protein n=1 Tax=Deinococcus arboris TaxID=2682977 RepID=A0A7C9HY16_9DEIO|nr:MULTISPECIES: DUF805 domain-containing protein [Deinococcus]MBZ9751375.1 DUF805 domain-containing protein [Deinococcus betulae]MVN86668.1 DUF805 domain-containing protein [Deinococcus arboris]